MGPQETSTAVAATGRAAEARGPLSAEDLREIAEAKARRKKINRAAGVAGFNGWSTAIAAGLSAPFAFFGVPALLLCGGFAVVAYREFTGRRMLQQLHVGAGRLLGVNQIAFGLMLIGYCAWSLYGALTGPNPYAELIASEPEVARMLGSIDELYKVGAVAVYGGVIAVTLIVQGLMASYYFSRGPLVRAYVQATPSWVVELERLA
jgi:hypothetical protein